MLDYGLNASRSLLSGCCVNKYMRRKKGRHEGKEEEFATTTQRSNGRPII